MNQNEIKVFFSILRSAIDSAELNDDEIQVYSRDMLPHFLELSAKHDIANLLAFGLKQNALISKEDRDIEKYIFKAVYRYERLKYEYVNLCAVLEKAQIPFLPLKGSVIRQYYPEPWMRTSCDIDILVCEEDCEKAKSVLIETCGYTYHEKGSHDISFFTSSNVHVELHYDLVEDGKANDSSKVLKNIWSKVHRRDGMKYWCEMPDEIYYFYHIAHMAKHFEDGGCGIRPFLDIWILNHRMDFDREKRNKLLSDGGLIVFAKQAELLTEIWFGNAGYTKTTKQMEDYILRGGVYGTNTNRIAVQQQKQGGKVKYALLKIFIPYDVIKFHYPILQKHKWLTSIMEVRRWGKLIFCGHLKRTAKELKYNSMVSEDVAVEMRTLLKNLGL